MRADREIKVRCSACGHLTRIPTVTNADRIRSMTDEELAMWIHQTRHNPLDDRTLTEWLDWLKQEAKE